MRTLRSILSHAAVIFSGMFITLTILNQYNPGMGFLTSTVSMVFILLYCLSVIALAAATIVDNRRHARHMLQRAEESTRRKRALPQQHGERG